MTEPHEIEFNEREVGVYPAEFKGAVDFEYTDQATAEVEHRWRWKFSDANGDFDTITTRTFLPGSNALKFFTGLLGRPPIKGDKPNDSIGLFVNVIYGPNRNGKLTITDVMPLKPAKG